MINHTVKKELLDWFVKHIKSIDRQLIPHVNDANNHRLKLNSFA